MLCFIRPVQLLETLERTSTTNSKLFQLKKLLDQKSTEIIQGATIPVHLEMLEGCQPDLVRFLPVFLNVLSLFKSLDMIRPLQMDVEGIAPELMKARATFWFCERTGIKMSLSLVQNQPVTFVR